MLFHSWDFAVFFALVMALYWRLGHRAQNLLLVAASYVFYGWWRWDLLWLMLLSSLIDFLCALRIEKGGPGKKLWLLTSVLSNMGLLGYFKYWNFFTDEFNALLRHLGLGDVFGGVEIILPVGISFYTFQTLSYTIDVYRGSVQPCRKLTDFLLYVSFFPQLVAGPIERSTTLLPQVEGPRRLDPVRLRDGAFLVFWGLFRKLVLADNLGILVGTIFDPGGMDHVSGTLMLLGCYAFTLQIYCDFSAYSDIARGTAWALGFNLMENFRAPYGATSPRDFWRRWHISLSTWLRDYLYIPLGGNRGGVWASSRNLLLVMALGGLWHGASWPFVIWGLYHGLLLALHRLMGSHLTLLTRVPRAIKVFITFHAVALGFMVFRSDSVDRILRNLRLLAGEWRWADLASTEGRWILFAALSLLAVRRRPDGNLNIQSWPLAARVILFVLAYFSMTLLHCPQPNDFIYFQF
ncbi:MAG: MBOAT family protein [Planctomycetota bacterium]